MNGTRGSAHWVAHYTFTQTGRPVLSDVRVRFRFGDGLIVEHHDDFNFHRWASQALGPAGILMGWTPKLSGAVRRRARGPGQVPGCIRLTSRHCQFWVEIKPGPVGPAPW